MAVLQTKQLHTGLALVGLTAWLVLASLWHLTQGTAPDTDFLILTQSRLPRLGAALVVGVALGVAGAGLQSVTHNPLASPDTLAVNAGAHLSLTIVTAFGISTGIFWGTAIAFFGGLGAATLVIAIAGTSKASATRLVLAGSVVALGFSAITTVLLLLFPWNTQGLFAWGAGSLTQRSPDTVLAIAPILLLAVAAILALKNRLNLLQLGDDAARALGVNVTATRILTVVLAVLLAACAVTVAGPIGFVGLCAPLLMRLLASRVPGLAKQGAFIIGSGIAGVALVLTADVSVRALFGAVSGVTIPTGVITSLIGAIALIAMVTRLRATSDSGLAAMRAGSDFARRRPGVIILGGLIITIAATIAGILMGDVSLLLGDVQLWLQDQAPIRIEIILDARAPRITAALLAGAALALAGSIMQTFTRNPLADPGVLGISGAAGLGAVITLIAGATAFAAVFAGAMVGAVAGAVLVFGLALRANVSGTLGTMRIILIGVGLSAGTSAAVTLLLVRTDPYNQNKALTWLGGSTFGAAFNQQVILLTVLIITALVAKFSHRGLDIVAVSEQSALSVGVNYRRFLIGYMALVVALTAAATATVGTIAFVGLVAPHMARIIIGKHHRWQLPLAGLLGASLVVISDTLGRWLLAPIQLPAGTVIAILGAPYFVWLLWRIRQES